VLTPYSSSVKAARATDGRGEERSAIVLRGGGLPACEQAAVKAATPDMSATRRGANRPDATRFGGMAATGFCAAGFGSTGFIKGGFAKAGVAAADFAEACFAETVFVETGFADATGFGSLGAPIFGATGRARLTFGLLRIANVPVTPRTTLARGPAVIELEGGRRLPEPWQNRLSAELITSEDETVSVGFYAVTSRFEQTNNRAARHALQQNVIATGRSAKSLIDQGSRRQP
jgi:hypothetical protein